MLHEDIVEQLANSNWQLAVGDWQFVIGQKQGPPDVRPYQRPSARISGEWFCQLLFANCHLPVRY
jgi:hypothetical protein